MYAWRVGTAMDASFETDVLRALLQDYEKKVRVLSGQLKSAQEEIAYLREEQRVSDEVIESYRDTP